MRKVTSFMFAFIFAFALGANAQEVKKAEGYQFTDIKRLPTTSVKDQASAGTCWAWSGISFFESEMIRMGKKPIDLSAMYVVKRAYSDKATKYVRMHGTMNFGTGGAFCDVMHVLQNYGIVPMEVYQGLNYGEETHIFGELETILKAYVDAVIMNPNKRLTTAWKRGYDSVLEAYLGEEPDTFTYEGKEYTPKTFAEEVVGLDMNDYVSLTSFTHHPFYSQFAIEVQDNWLWGLSYNLPLDELMRVMDNAIDNGYTFAWASDVSERGFATVQPGVAVIPTTDVKEMSGAEIAKWEAMPKNRQSKDAFKLGPAPEKQITQEIRQKEFDNYLTTDDHGMHVIGKAKDQNGTEYFIVKNSWNEYNKFGGYFYASKPFMAFKTMNIIVHKNAIPKDIKKKLGLK